MGLNMRIPKSGDMWQAQVAGALMLLSGVFILMGIITSETQYPRSLGYSTRSNEISDLGATQPPHSVITQPSAHLFDFTMILVGLMLIAAAVILFVATHRLFTIFTLLLGIGVLGVGLFPGNYHNVHRVFSLDAFLFGGLAAAFSYRLPGRAFRYIALMLGLTTLFFLFIGTATLANVLGDGGIERWIAYPVVLWMVCLGGYILGTDSRSPI
jgi:hypothetical membrane protein